MQGVVLLIVIMPNVNAECHYAKCCVGLSANMQDVVLLTVFMLIVVRLKVAALEFIVDR
jgi:hypothetical protein